MQLIFWTKVETVMTQLWKVSGIRGFSKPLQRLEQRISKCDIPAWYLYDRAVGKATSYGLDGRGFETRQRDEILSSPISSRPALRPKQPLTGTGRGMKLVSQLHLVPRLWTSGAIPPLPLHTFTAWTGIPLPFYLHLSIMNQTTTK